MCLLRVDWEMKRLLAAREKFLSSANLMNSRKYSMSISPSPTSVYRGRFSLEYDDESVGRRSFAVIVYDDETYDWVSYEVPADSDRARNTEALDPITINGVEFVGYRSINMGSDGTEYHYALYMGVVNGHYIEILCTDGSADGVLFEDQMNMARSIHIK